MKAKAGSGRPIETNRLQSLQSGLFSLLKKDIYFDSDLRYKNSWDWRAWSPMESNGNPPKYSGPELREYASHWKVSSQCLNKWLNISTRTDLSGNVCICGHPEHSHVDGGLCNAGSTICVCRKPRLVLWVDDIRYFFRATKGPHEGHALVLGLTALLQGNGKAQYQIEWRCEYQSCGGKVGVNPARFRNGIDIALGMPVNDLNKLICEPCLFRKLNDGYVSA